MTKHRSKAKYRHLFGSCLRLSAALLFCAAGTITAFRDISQPVYAEQDTEPPDELSVDPTGRGDGYSAVLYDNTSGLPTSEANTIAETEEGFIWIGSYCGLIRYDGNTFERIEAGSNLASVMNLFVDSQNRLWVGTNDSGAAVMIDGEFTIFNKKNGLSSLSVRCIAEDPDGNIYIATTDGLGVVDQDLHLTMIDEPQINSEFIRMIRVCGDTVYGVTKSGAVFTMKNQKLTGYYSPEAIGITEIHSICPDPAHPGCVYIGSQGSQLCYGELTGSGFKLTEQTDLAPFRYINDIQLVGDMVWVCSDTGIGFLSDGSFIPISNIPMTTAVEGMMLDYQKNLWFVSSQQGVMKIVPNQFSDIFEKYSLPDEVVYSTAKYDGKLFIGTKNSGLIVLDENKKCRSLPITESVSASGKAYDDTDLIELLKSARIRSIIRDSQNRLWFSTFGHLGLLRYDGGKLMRFSDADGLPSERVRTVYERSDGSFLAVCTGGLAVIRNDQIERVYGESDGIMNTEILTAAENNAGETVIGTDGGGIYIINGGEITHCGTDDGLSSDVVMRIKKDVSRDILWIITSNSIAYMTPDHTIKTVTQFPYFNNFDLYENSRGEMWVLSSNGIYVAEADQMLKNEEIPYLFYNRDNGLPCIATSNSYSELSENGELCIAGTTGAAIVNIETPFENVSELKISVPYLEADGKLFFPDATGRFDLPASTKKMTIFSYVYNYSLINPQVTYQLSGFDSTPVTVQRSELVPQSYTNLRGGEYRFNLQIEDPHGISSKELSVLIVKKSKPYELIWVRVLGLLLAVALVALLIQLITDRRTKILTARSQEQKQLIREIVEAFSKVIDMKDRYTNGHSARVAMYTVMLARELGIDEETIDNYYCIALLHDIGKIGVPPEVLNKPGKLTDEEFRIIKSHSGLGYNALKNISIMPELATGAGAHHERPDGKGYPKGLTGDEIPRVAQIIAVADTFDAMYSDRPYRKRMNFEKAVSIIKDCRGTQLTSDVVDAFLRLVEQGKMRAEDDTGGGTTEDIDNIHKKQNDEAANQTKPAESSEKPEAKAES